MMLRLRRRFKKDSSLFENYQCFMDDLVANGFSGKKTSPSTDDSIWYLPHHEVLIVVLSQIKSYFQDQTLPAN